jgi:hypothetical protein
VRAAAFLRMALIFRERHFDRIEVRAVGRQEEHDGAGGLDGFADGDWLMGGQVVEDDDIAGLEDRTQDLLDIGEEGLSGHRAVDGHGGDDAVGGEAADEGRGLPMAVRDRSAAALASGRAAIHTGHLGRRPAFIDEDEALGIEVGLSIDPGVPPARYVGPVLFSGVRRLFLRVTPRRLKKSCTTLGGGR